MSYATELLPASKLLNMDNNIPLKSELRRPRPSYYSSVSKIMNILNFVSAKYLMLQHNYALWVDTDFS